MIALEVSFIRLPKSIFFRSSLECSHSGRLDRHTHYQAARDLEGGRSGSGLGFIRLKRTFDKRKGHGDQPMITPMSIGGE